MYEEGRSVRPTAGGFEDAFAPLGVHVYIVRREGQ